MNTMTTQTTPANDTSNLSFADALLAFVNGAQEMLDAHHAKHTPNIGRSVLEIETGRRYVRIVKRDGTVGRAVYCFVDRTNGDVLKSASWKAPAKGARGNIYASNPISGVGVYGAHYFA